MRRSGIALPHLRDPAKRHQDLRAFIAKGRRERRAKNDDPTTAALYDNDDDDISVRTAPGGPPEGAFGSGDEAEMESTPPSPPPSAAPVLDGNDDGLVHGARRNIGLDFDEEDKVWGCAEGGGVKYLEADVGEAVGSKREKGGERGTAHGEEDGEGERKANEGGEDDQEEWEGGRGGRAMSQQRCGSRDVLVELSTLKCSVVTERHEVTCLRWRIFFCLLAVRSQRITCGFFLPTTFDIAGEYRRA